MKFKKEVVYLLFPLMTLTGYAFGQNPVGADNSRVNERDRATSELTADQQKTNERDTAITAKIRQDIMKEKSFSTYAQNIKIITVHGKVTLKGPVRTDTEASKILKYARAAAGDSNVSNEMAVTPEKSN